MGNSSSQTSTETPVSTSSDLTTEDVIQKEIEKEREKPGQTQFNEGQNALKKRDYNEAFVYFQAADELGFGEATLEVGKMYRDGLGTQQNIDCAIRFFQKAIDDGLSAGSAELGLIYYHGLGGEQVDLGNAVYHFRNGIEVGDMDCTAHFGWMTIQGQGVPEKNYSEGLQMIQDAEIGLKSLWALNYLGFINLEGVEEHRIDYDTAFKYFTKASDLGHLEAKVNLAFMHLQGKGTKPSVWEAAKLFTVAAERGHSIAQVHLGMMYRDGVAVKPNITTAKQWFERAAAQKDALGSYCLGKLLMDTPTSDWLDIVDLYQHAAQQGNVRGIMYDSIYIDSLARIFDGYVNT